MSTTETTTETVTFETGYRRLQEIAERVNSDEVPVSEMCELFAEGKGLEQALSSYLSDQKARVEQIERGEGIQAFKVVAASDGAGAGAEAAESSDDDFIEFEPEPVRATTSDFAPAPSPAGASDDDIPF